MPSYQPVSFQSPGYDYSAELSAIERRKALAQALQQQSMQPATIPQAGPGQFQASISPFEGAAKIAQAYAANKQSKRAEEEQRKLATTAQQNLASVLMNAQKAAAGTPATPLSEDASGNVTPAQPAVPGDMGKAASIYMQHPMTAPLGMSMAQKEMDQQARQRAMAEYMKREAPAAGGNAPAYGSPGFQPQQQSSDPMAGLPPKIVGMLTSGDPEIIGVGKILAENYKMQNVRPGGTVYQPGVGPLFTAPQAGQQTTWGPQGPMAAAIPNAQEITARGAGLTAAAQEAGKAPYTLKEFNTAGAPTVMTQQQAIERATGAPMAQPGAPVQTGQGGIPNLAQQAGMQNYRSPTALGGGGFRLQDQGENAFQGEYGRELARSASKIVEGGDMGRRLNDQANAMEEARRRLIAAGGDVNKFAGVQQSVSELAQAMNIDPKTLNLPAGAGPLQMMDAVTNRMAMSMIGPGGMPANNFSEADRNFVVSTMSRKSDTPEGFTAKIDLMRKVAQRNIQAEQSWLAAEEQGISHSRWRRQWNRYVSDNPLYPKGGAAPTAPQAPIYATNGQQRIMSTDGGKTWQPAK